MTLRAGRGRSGRVIAAPAWVASEGMRLSTSWRGIRARSPPARGEVPALTPTRHGWLGRGSALAYTGCRGQSKLSMVPWMPAVQEALRVTLGKGGQSNYFHPLAEWIPHVSLYTVGPAFTILLLGLGAAVVHERSRTLARLLVAGRDPARRCLRVELSGARPLFWCHLFLLLLYAATFVWSRNRVTRPAIPMMLAAFGLVLVGARTLPSLRRWLAQTPAKLIGLGLTVVAWAVLTYQLMFAFDGGKTYGHHGSRLEYFNYPLRIRPLTGPDDSHVCSEVCPYDQR